MNRKFWPYTWNHQIIICYLWWFDCQSLLLQKYDTPQRNGPTSRYIHMYIKKYREKTRDVRAMRSFDAFVHRKKIRNSLSSKFMGCADHTIHRVQNIHVSTFWEHIISTDVPCNYVYYTSSSSENVHMHTPYWEYRYHICLFSIVFYARRVIFLWLISVLEQYFHTFLSSL